MATLEELHVNIRNAMAAFNLRRAAILQKAFEEGGDDLVLALEGEFDAMRDARFEIVQREFDENNDEFAEVAERAKTQAEAIEASVNSLTSTQTVLEDIGAFLNTAGRLVMLFGL